jgi:hypothetical protein
MMLDLPTYQIQLDEGVLDLVKQKPDQPFKFSLCIKYNSKADSFDIAKISLEQNTDMGTVSRALAKVIQKKQGTRKFKKR